MNKLAGIFLVLVVAIGLVWKLGSPQSAEPAVSEEESDVAVQSAPIVRADMHAYVVAYGRVAPQPGTSQTGSLARLSPAVAGVVTGVNVIEGQSVNAGDLLFQLDQRLASEVLDFAEKALQRQQQLAADGNAAAKSVEAAMHERDLARTQLALLKITAPVAGTVMQVLVTPGQAVDSSTVMAEILDLNRLVIAAGVAANELAAVQLGQSADIVTDDGSTVAGSLSFIAAGIDVNTGSVPVRVTVPAQSGLRLGQFVTLRMTSEVHANSLAVPEASVVRNADGEDVVAVIDNNLAHQIPVQAGLRENGLVEVTGPGLQAGMQVVTTGAYGLPAETRVHRLAD